MDVYPSLTYRDVSAALEHLQPELPDDLHGEHAGQGWVYIVVDDPDAHHAGAKVAGAEVLGEPHDAFGGRQRGYSARDPEGNLWSFGTSRPETS